MIKQSAYFLFSVCFFFSCINKHNSINCNQFRNGKFELKGKKTGIKYWIERHDSVQLETDQETGKAIQMNIKWIDDCTYELSRLAEISDTIYPGGVKRIKEYLPVKATIIIVKKNYYVFEARNDKYDFSYRDTIWVLK